ncbi:MAG TPA: hypothetical protein VHU85_14955 [Acidimicrobiales bacterium]|jgi:hypothetical protein|nr:hypothetical protein [Acidimicrobiales bacterium]
MDLSGGLAPELDLPRLEGDEDDPHFGENEALWLWDAEAQVGFHLYLRTLPYAYRLRRETINVFFGGSSVLVSRQDGPGSTPDTARGPSLACRVTEPFVRRTYSYDATARPTSTAAMREGLLPDGTVVLLSFDIETTMAVPPWVTGTFSTGEALEQARQSFGGHRYEQLLRATGTIRVRDCYGAPGIDPFGDRDVTFSAVGLRTHRMGSRNLTSFPGHTWLTGLFPSGRAFGLMRFCGADGVPHWEEAVVFDGERYHPARVSDATLFSQELPGEALTAVLESDLGQWSVTGKLEATNFVSAMPPEPQRWGIDRSRGIQRIMKQGVATFGLDGEAGAGMVERSVMVSDMPALSPDRAAG